MKKLIDIKFKGEFRDYQKKILDRSEQYLKDGKIHIVAAPGSGKTTLGLELICRLNSPALILTPTVTIRQQWGERFAEAFLSEDDNVKDYLSYNLHKPSQITSITYQALYAAFNKLLVNREDDEEGSEPELEPELEPESEIDFANFDLLQVIKEANIKIICLDEAHHLKSEWQKALESFIGELKKQVTIISLTATPPYDSTPGEWKRYSDLCGEIDEEIYVPQLVVQNTLCPHQDYIYFNYPTKEETAVFNQFRQKAIACASEILQGQLFEDIITHSGLLTEFRNKEEYILDNAKGFIALICLAKYRGINLPKKLIKLVSPSGKIPKISLEFTEKAFQFVIDSPSIFTEEVSTRLNLKLSENSLIINKQVHLKLNDKISKLLLTSTGKLKSITDIVQHESNNRAKELRMLILTDFIKKDLLKLVGSDEPINTMGTVPIFEAVRRRCGDQINIGLLSGGLVLIPSDVLPQIKLLADKKNTIYSTKKLENTNYLEIDFKGSSKNSVSIITEAFEEGFIQVLIGTKSLLGEGWDSPCINSLILASFVGSFVLSNQMRGRAIRVDIRNPSKVSNIWHLVTVEPPFVYDNKGKQILLTPLFEDKNQLQSDDFETLKRRFNCFLAPSYSKDVIENGIERLDIIKPPFDEKGIDRINNQMLTLATDREGIIKRWNGVVGGSHYSDVVEMNEIPNTVQPKGFLFQNILLSLLLALAINIFVRNGWALIASSSNNFFQLLMGSVLFIILGYLFLGGLIKIYRYLSPRKTIETLSQCIFSTLKDIHEIESIDAKVIITSDDMDTNIYTCLINATLHEKYVFAQAMRELLSTIDNPRYLLIKKYGFFNYSLNHYSHSYACPSIIGTKKENVQLLTHYLIRSTGKFSLLYTRSEKGRKVLLQCRKRSYINLNEAVVKNKKMASKWE